MKIQDRRNFLRNSVIGLSGAALLPQINASGMNTGAAVPQLPTRILGKTGLKVPLISMGTAGATNPGFVKAAYDAGVKLFFSATYYGEGNNEILVGQALKNLPRNSYLIGTAASPDGLDNRTGAITDAFKPENFMKKAEESLKRFGLEQIDFVLLPYASKKETVLHDGVLKILQQLKQQGKVKYVGLASHSGMIEALDAATKTDVYDVAMISYNFKIQNVADLNAAVNRAVKAGIGVIAMKSTAGVYRSKSGPQLNSNAVLKWVLQNQDVATIVSAMSSTDELQKNMAMLKDIKMSEQEKKDLDLASLGSDSSLYCQQCGECIPQCQHNLNIPAIMRGYMYAYGYKNLEQAWYTLSDAGIRTNPCSSCEECNIKCKSGFEVKARITDIARLADVPVDLIRA